MAETSGSAPPRRLVGSLKDRLRAWRARLVADPAFQRRAARFPLTRRLSRRRSEDLFRLTSGFVHSQILFACVELDLFRLLAERPLTTARIAAATGLSEDGARVLLEAAAAIDLVAVDRGEDGTQLWRLADLGAVVGGNEGVAAMIRHHAMLYRDLADPAGLLRTNAAGASDKTETACFWAYAGARAAPESVSEEEARAYSALMTASQDFIAAEALDAYSLKPHRVLLDIGGGEGAFLAAAGRRWPELRLRLFDLPPVAAAGEAALTKAGFGSRCEAHGGDFFRDEPPRGADCVSFVRVLCDHDDDAALAILRNVRASMAPGACALIAEPMAGPREGESLAAAYFGFYFLAMRSGRCRTPDEIRGLLIDAGFVRPHRVRTRNPLMASVVVVST